MTLINLGTLNGKGRGNLFLALQVVVFVLIRLHHAENRDFRQSVSRGELFA
jgi:hypothetical protein